MEQQQFVVTGDLVSKLMAYLSRRPHAEVNELIVALSQQLGPQLVAPSQDGPKLVAEAK